MILFYKFYNVKIFNCWFLKKKQWKQINGKLKFFYSIDNKNILNNNNNIYIYNSKINASIKEKIQILVNQHLEISNKLENEVKFFLLNN